MIRPVLTKWTGQLNDISSQMPVIALTVDSDG